jgi:hypothetical protein
MIKSCIKELTDNDLGKTGSHQAGFLVPKMFIDEGLFDQLSSHTLNPRQILKFVDLDTREVIFLNFIFYNNRLFGGTRLEYRLTGITRWLKDRGLRPRDAIEITRLDETTYSLMVIKAERRPTTLSAKSWMAVYGKEEIND